MNIHDDYASWNNGKFLLANKKIEKLSSDYEVDLELDVNVLIPLIFGNYSATELCNMGLIKGDSQKIQILTENVQVKSGFFIDFF
ncbi:hypothetical protein FZC78_13875 [Rossellomorea vietnamensis]|uniref:Enhanced intracellular survival protein domain-containing protein n=1 Tax=Rossellomorea vietnamensis TaxID=218284 RepID=A0A5D4NQV6_9BACI|nr:hypothetical protein FZC78_13875 [Rossellomorea vietnamensis]